MTQKQIELVENSWDYVIINALEAGTNFYTKLFELDPALRQLFREDIRLQSQKLVSLITFVVHKLNNMNDVIADVKALGKRHKNYRVKKEHYSLVEQALLWTLEKGLGDQWNHETENAWRAAYSILSDTMIKASQDTEPAVI
ncbi:MAG TPA: globin family protein [Cyclobacteriaceae bacterium]|jgi:nitric oxide dioxygenase|nr:globin family protein [Cyclobacteriaceae bacterium]